MLRQRLHLLPAVRPMTALGVGRLLHQPFCFSLLHRVYAQRQKGLWPISSQHLGSSINGHSSWISVATTASAAAIPETTILAGGGIWQDAQFVSLALYCAQTWWRSCEFSSFYFGRFSACLLVCLLAWFVLLCFQIYFITSVLWDMKCRAGLPPSVTLHSQLINTINPSNGSKPLRVGPKYHY